MPSNENTWEATMARNPGVNNLPSLSGPNPFRYAACPIIYPFS